MEIQKSCIAVGLPSYVDTSAGASRENIYDCNDALWFYKLGCCNSSYVVNCADCPIRRFCIKGENRDLAGQGLAQLAQRL